MKIKWFGTAALSIEDNGVKILVDPFVRMNKRLNPVIEAKDFYDGTAIFATHGHVDHIYSIPEIEKTVDTPVYCTKTPVASLKRDGVPEDRLHLIKPGDKVSVGHLTVTVFQAKHVSFDAKYVLSVIPKSVVLCPKIFKLEYLNIKYPENEENLGLLIEGSGKSVFIMGSFGTVDYETYPKNCDMFVLPVGGCTKIPDLTAPFISETTPKKVFVTHFDNAFPPATRHINTDGLKARIAADHPEIETIIPTELVEYEV